MGRPGLEFAMKKDAAWQEAEVADFTRLAQTYMV
jgi:hypothetical protein